MVCAIAVVLTGLVLTPASAADSARVNSVCCAREDMVEYARSAAIARPDRTYLIKVDQIANAFWLALASAPGTPIAHPLTGKPFRVQLGAGSTQGYSNLCITQYSLGGDDEVRFDATGCADQVQPITIEIGIGARRFTLNVSASDGVVSLQAT